jgi:phosphoadenosine phosphosulfate reductase
MTTFNQQATEANPDIEQLNELFSKMPFEQRISMLYKYFRQDEVLYTSSFGTKSIMLLHLISKIRPSQKVYFINTGFHFRETIEYKNQVVNLLGLHTEDILPDPTQHQFSIEEKAWETAPDLCCAINKVAALDPIKARHKVWISGLMAYQTDYRSELNVFEEQDGILKFHPLIDIDEGELLYHLGLNKLPRHPLEGKGYGSVGCTHCTVKGKGREGRWKGKTKTECGLHPSKAAQSLLEVK